MIPLGRPNSRRTRWPLLSLTALLLSALPAQLDAGAWTQPPGGLYLKLAGLSFRSQEYHDAEGKRGLRIKKPHKNELSDNNISVYLEYGLRERLTLVATLPYKRLLYTEVREFNRSDTNTIDTRIQDEKESGFADLEMRMRWRLLEDPAVVSVTLGGKLPLGYEMQEESNVHLGTAEIDGDTRLLVGKSLYPLPGYATGAIGYRRRGGIFSDELLYSLEAGFTYGNLLFKGVAEGLRTFGDCGVTGAMGMLIGDRNSLKLAPGVIWSLSERLELGADLFHIVSGCNTAAGTTWALGLAFKR